MCLIDWSKDFWLILKHVEIGFRRIVIWFVSFVGLSVNSIFPFDPVQFFESFFANIYFLVTRLRPELNSQNDRFKSCKRKSIDWKVMFLCKVIPLIQLFIYLFPLQTSWCTRRKNTNQSRTNWTRHLPNSLVIKLIYAIDRRRPNSQKQPSCHKIQCSVLCFRLYILFIIKSFK